MSVLSVLFFIPFCRFRGNNRFGGERFPTEEVVIVFFVLCHISCMEILTAIIYLFHIETFSTKILAFFTPFFIATNIAKHFPRMIQKQLSILPSSPSLSSEQASF